MLLPLRHGVIGDCGVSRCVATRLVVITPVLEVESVNGRDPANDCSDQELPHRCYHVGIVFRNVVGKSMAHGFTII